MRYRGPSWSAAICAAMGPVARAEGAPRRGRRQVWQGVPGAWNSSQREQGRSNSLLIEGPDYQLSKRIDPDFHGLTRRGVRAMFPRVASRPAEIS